MSNVTEMQMRLRFECEDCGWRHFNDDYRLAERIEDLDMCEEDYWALVEREVM